MIDVFEMAPDIEDRIQFLLREESLDSLILREEGFEIFAPLPDTHGIPLDYAISLFSR